MKIWLLAIALCSVPGMAAAQDADVAIRTEPVAPGVHVLYGSGGNIGVSSGPDGIFLIDDQYAVVTPKITEALAKLSPGPPRFVLNTHWHGDHAGGNAAFAEAPRGDAFVISHSPDPFPNMPPQSALMLAGHGHCGQVTVPFVGRPITPLRNPAYVCGLIQDEEREMFVTGGVGTSILPVRFLNPPEIVVVTLSATPDLRDSLPEF